MSDMQAINNEYFNKTAQDYDAFPQADEMTTRASQVIVQEYISSTSDEHVKNSSALDFGCGTGLCAFKIAPHVKSILGVDASEGMLKHLNHKLLTRDENAAIRDKVKTLEHLVTVDAPLPEPELSQYVSGPGLNGGFDLVYSSFVMHHIEDVQGVVNALSQKLLKKDGWLVVLDLQGDHYHHHGDHQYGESGGADAHGHGHHGHGHGHGHHNHAKASSGDKVVTELKELFKDENGKALDYVAHQDGFTPERFVEIFKKAGLVEVSAKHAFGLNSTMHGKEGWLDTLVVKGRRA